MTRIRQNDWLAGNSPRLGLLCFDRFKLDVASGELCMGGTRIVLQPQPFKVLALLAECSGRAITRDEIRRQLWSSETFVDFEGGLNFCIRQIRKALGEDARKPRYIETLHRRGYRFMAPVTRVDDASESHAGNARAAGSLPTHERRPITLAVLPFTDLSCSFHQDLLADGITELLITYLSTDRSLRVVSRTTSMRYKDTDKSLPHIGKELGVDWVLEGAVLHSGRRVRIVARLIDTSTDQNQWAACYEAEMQDRLALQDRVASMVYRDTTVHLLPQLRGRALLEVPQDMHQSRMDRVERVRHLPIATSLVRRVGEGFKTLPVFIAAESRHAQPAAGTSPRPRI